MSPTLKRFTHVVSDSTTQLVEISAMTQSNKTGRELKPERGRKGAPWARRLFARLGMPVVRTDEDDE